MQFVQVYLKLLFVCGFVTFCHGKFVNSPTDENLRTPLKQHFELTCKYDGPGGDGEFLEWYRDDSPVSAEKTGHYQVSSSPSETTLQILIFVQSDELIKEWHVKSNKVNDKDKKACRFGQIKLIPSPQEMKTNSDKKVLFLSEESVRRVEGDIAEFTCVIKPELDPERPSERLKIRWDFSDDNVNFLPIHAGSFVDNGVSTDGDRLVISKVEKLHRGFYRCSLNNVAFTFQLRVKDRLAALWPFLGIVGTVLTLVIIIIIFESRQKSNRRPAATDDDDHDHANDPLVRQPNKSSDNENKKRTVKA